MDKSMALKIREEVTAEQSATDVRHAQEEAKARLEALASRPVGGGQSRKKAHAGELAARKARARRASRTARRSRARNRR